MSNWLTKQNFAVKCHFNTVSLHIEIIYTLMLWHIKSLEREQHELHLTLIPRLYIHVLTTSLDGQNIHLTLLLHELCLSLGTLIDF